LVYYRAQYGVFAPYEAHEHLEPTTPQPFMPGASTSQEGNSNGINGVNGVGKAGTLPDRYAG
jgi:hypothetical protein